MKVACTVAWALLASLAIAQQPERGVPPDAGVPIDQVGNQQGGTEQDGPEQDHEALCRAICEAQDRGEFGVLDAIDKLAGSNESVARTAAAIVRHQWQELPAEFFVGLDANPRAAYRFLAELARAPRPQAAQWVIEQTAERRGRSLDHRLLALAARGQPLSLEESQLLLQALVERSLGDGVYFAAAQLPERVADRLMGRLHRGLMAGTILVDVAMPLLDRLSVRGTKSLLALAVTLPEAIARRLLRHVYELQPQLVQERVTAALDGKVPLDALWLEFARKLLDRPERVARVVAMMTDAELPADRDRAFELLLSEGCLAAEMLPLAIEGPQAIEGETEARIRRVIAVGANSLPKSYVVAWLQHSPTIAMEMARALAMRPVLEPEVQQQLLAMLDGLGAADRHTPLHALTALVHAGDAEALQTVWPLIMGGVAWRDLCNRLAKRTEPYVYEILLAGAQTALAQPVDADPEREQVRQQQLDTLRLMLVARGDRRELQTLIANAPQRSASFVRKCRQYATTLTMDQAESLWRAALQVEDPGVASELIEWVVLTQPKLATSRLWQLWNDRPELPAIEELLEIAMRLLVTGPKRESLLQQLRDAYGKGPLPEEWTSLPYEAINSMATPLDVSDVTLCAELLLKMPLTDPEREQRWVARWPDGTVGFPLVAAIANRLRAADAMVVEQVFVAMVDELIDDPRRVHISPQRLKVFWRSLSFRPELQRLLGRITSRLWTQSDGQPEITSGAAVWLQALQAEHEQRYGAAEKLYQQAGRELLRLPSMRGEARWVLGDRDPMHGDDPLAALSAAPYRMALLEARQLAVAAAVSSASLLVREFAGHDRATLATLNPTPAESGR